MTSLSLYFIELKIARLTLSGLIRLPWFLRSENRLAVIFGAWHRGAQWGIYLSAHLTISTPSSLELEILEMTKR